jgi:hypothetical protein
MAGLGGLTPVPLGGSGDLTTVPFGVLGVLTTVPMAVRGGLTTVPLGKSLRQRGLECCWRARMSASGGSAGQP